MQHLTYTVTLRAGGYGPLSSLVTHLGHELAGAGFTTTVETATLTLVITLEAEAPDGAACRTVAEAALRRAASALSLVVVALQETPPDPPV